MLDLNFYELKNYCIPFASVAFVAYVHTIMFMKILKEVGLLGYRSKVNLQC